MLILIIDIPFAGGHFLTAGLSLKAARPFAIKRKFFSSLSSLGAGASMATKGCAARNF
jgi:hypothetical protein